jgi:NitT/TauT family transport system substrate-binding protein
VTYIYKELGLLATPTRFDEVMDFSVIKALDAKGGFADMKNEYVSSFTPMAYQTVQAETPILTQTIRINFYPNSANIFEPQHDELGNAVKNTLYDPSAEATLEKVARLTGQYERAVIGISGHADNSMKGRAPREVVEKLSLDRANAVKTALTSKYKFPPNKFVVEGKAWDVPADPSQPDNQALNRRVEIAIYPPEK